MNEIENTSCVRSIKKVTPVIRIEIEYLGAASVIRRFNDGVCICTYSVRSDEYICKTKHANNFINQNILGISLIIDLMRLFVFWRIMTEIQGKM